MGSSVTSPSRWKKIVVIEAFVRRDLQLEDVMGFDCLPNATIFEQLTFMGYEKLSQKLTFYKAFFSPQGKFLIHTILQCLSAKTTAWNEFSSTMASAIICLATNQKFNFSKYIFESMVRNLDTAVKFLMYLRFVQGRIYDIDIDKDNYLVNVHRDEDMFGVNDLEGDEIVVETLKSAKVQEKGDVIKEPSVPVSAASTKVSTVIPTTAATIITAVSSRPRAKGIVFHEQEQVLTHYFLQQQPTTGHGQCKRQNGSKLLAQEARRELSDAEKERIHYLYGYIIGDKESSMKAEAETSQESSSKRAGKALEQESSKKQKVDDDKETEELKQCMEIISDDGDDVTIKATPLSTKSQHIVDYKIYKEGKKSYFQIIRADGNSQMYLTFGKMHLTEKIWKFFGV
ncbi:hypothetical protein Tco_0604274 [Tanacetum coccineum]